MDLLTDYPYLIYILAMLGGTIAGFINTLAGSGSLITLPILIFLGLPPSVANGTNRIGILLQSIVGIFKFNQSGMLPWKNGSGLIYPTTIGSIIGSFIAIDLNEQMMNYAIATVMSAMLVVIIFKPEQWLKEHTELAANYRGVGNFLLFFVIGMYGGFIQAGVGVFLLIAMVARCGFSMVNANAIKLVLVLIFTVPAAAIFIYYDQVNWWLGGIMAIGQGAGAWIAAHYASGNKNAALWTRRLLITVIVLSIIKLVW
jgi:uncharacterized membrane protein YfcA